MNLSKRRINGESHHLRYAFSFMHDSHLSYHLLILCRRFLWRMFGMDGYLDAFVFIMFMFMMDCTMTSIYEGRWALLYVVINKAMMMMTRKNGFCWTTAIHARRTLKVTHIRRPHFASLPESQSPASIQPPPIYVFQCQNRRRKAPGRRRRSSNVCAICDARTTQAVFSALQCYCRY